MWGPERCRCWRGFSGKVGAAPEAVVFREKSAARPGSLWAGRVERSTTDSDATKKSGHQGDTETKAHDQEKSIAGGVASKPEKKSRCRHRWSGGVALTFVGKEKLEIGAGRRGLNAQKETGTRG